MEDEALALFYILYSLCLISSSSPLVSLYPLIIFPFSKYTYVLVLLSSVFNITLLWLYKCRCQLSHVVYYDYFYFLNNFLFSLKLINVFCLMSWFSMNLSLIYLQPLPHLYKSPPNMFQYICYSAQFVFLKKFLLKPPALFQFRQLVNLYMCCTTVILRSLFIIIIHSHCCLLESEPSFFVIICISLDSLSHFSGDIF